MTEETVEIVPTVFLEKVSVAIDQFVEGIGLDIKSAGYSIIETSELERLQRKDEGPEYEQTLMLLEMYRDFTQFCFEWSRDNGAWIPTITELDEQIILMLAAGDDDGS